MTVRCKLCQAFDSSGERPVATPRVAHLKELADSAVTFALLGPPGRKRRRWRRPDGWDRLVEHVMGVYQCPARNLAGWPTPTINATSAPEVMLPPWRRVTLTCWVCQWRTPPHSSQRNALSALRDHHSRCHGSR